MNPHAETKTRRNLRWAVNAVGIVAFWLGFITLIADPDDHGLAAFVGFLIGLAIIQRAVERQGHKRGWDAGVAKTVDRIRRRRNQHPAVSVSWEFWEFPGREAREELLIAKDLLARSWESDVAKGCVCDWDDYSQGLWHIDRISPDCPMHGESLRRCLANGDEEDDR